ncbi:SDR family oxidoreductase [Cellulomonas oligotrophica]|uniref:Oxidoreductase n=1 Tax=Cellulomonas oligotrophica TaxID=931536 RepID=A0A7Y9FH67_9CELL|nr:SDR family NAD(P)-dependent oxidoreductase [Cellulomonas oligotrophica]NYD86997.1 short-subunit dehydrogenase involved in D-alanine esterification of teichoic acids [Cellulomonas oligotrophica]GIG32217.1 oxidoreductase [Cellulomonas oligotrophica]
MDLTSRTVLVTGATSGIGRGLAERLADAGSTVVAAGRRADLLAEVAAHPRVHPLTLDVTDPASVASAVDDLLARFPALDTVLLNAGVMLPEDLTAGDDLATAELTVATNLLGPLRLAAALVPHLLDRPGAALVTTTSGLAYVPLPATPTYSATKAALASWTESLRVQTAGRLEVVELAPPAVRTGLMGHQASPHAMPLDDFLTESLALLAQAPTPPQVLVENVHPLRFARERGTYADVLATLSARTR